MQIIIYSQDGAYIVYIYPNGAANLDKRLKLFDKVIEVEGKKITADMSYSDLKKVFKRRYLVVSTYTHIICYSINSIYMRDACGMCILHILKPVSFENFCIVTYNSLRWILHVGKAHCQPIRSTAGQRNWHRNRKKSWQRNRLQFHWMPGSWYSCYWYCK